MASSTAAKNIIVISAAVHAKDLQHQNLGVGGHANHRRALRGIGGCNTGHVGTVVALVVMVMVNQNPRS